MPLQNSYSMRLSNSRIAIHRPIVVIGLSCIAHLESITGVNLTGVFCTGVDFTAVSFAGRRYGLVVNQRRFSYGAGRAVGNGAQLASVF